MARAGRFVRYDARSPARGRRWWGGHSTSIADRIVRLSWATPIAHAVSPFIFLVLRRDP